MSTLAKAHGMDGTLIAPDWPVLTMEELRAVLRQFPECGDPVKVLYSSPRPFSAASVVETTKGRVFVKRHHRDVRDGEGLREEHRFLQHLHAQGAPVLRVFADAGGETVFVKGDWTYELHEASTAVDLYSEALSWTPFRCTAHAHSAGQRLAQLHRAASHFEAPRRRQRPLVASFTIFAGEDPTAQMRAYIEARPALAGHGLVRNCADVALDLLAQFHAELQPLLPFLASLWTHNDLHASNLLWSNTSNQAQAAAIIDFGLADRTNAVHDLAHAIERNTVEWLVLVRDPDHPERVPVHFNHLHAFLQGYESVRALSYQEAHALAPMVALCHAEFALSEADYFLGVLHSEERAVMAYDGWLVGHARWFRSTGGKALLHWLRAWATEGERLRETA